MGIVSPHQSIIQLHLYWIQHLPTRFQDSLGFGQQLVNLAHTDLSHLANHKSQ